MVWTGDPVRASMLLLKPLPGKVGEFGRGGRGIAGGGDGRAVVACVTVVFVDRRVSDAAELGRARAMAAASGERESRL